MKTRLLAGFFVYLGRAHNPMGGFNCTEMPLLMVHQKL